MPKLSCWSKLLSVLLGLSLGLDCSGGTITSDASSLTDGGQITATNSGEICEPPAQTCTLPNERCIIQHGASKGTCQAPCIQLNDPCLTNDPHSQFSACRAEEKTATGTQFFCMYFCKVKDKAFSCPGETAYDCHILDEADPLSAGICDPQE